MYLPSTHLKKAKIHSPAPTSTASESCQKRQRIQNHMVALKNSAWITWDLVSWGNCLYRGSMCTPPPALRQNEHVKQLATSSKYKLIENCELHLETKPNFSHENQNDRVPQSLKVFVFHKFAFNL